VRVFIATIVVAGACGPTVKPPEPPAEPGPVHQGVKQIKVDPTGRSVMIGEMCPQGAGGRPAVSPLIMRGVGWNDSQAEVAATVERGSVPRFFVLGVDGKQAGIFDTLGLVEVGINQPVASGTYVGASPCTYAVGGKTGDRAEDPKCGPVTRGCGIAVGEIARPDEAAATLKLDAGGACMHGNELAIDIDNDGRIESFPLAGALDGIRAPAQEWLASPSSTATCTPTYQLYNLALTPEPRPGKSAEKATVTLDVLGVVDLDGDGRKELVLAMRFPTVRTIVVYTATESSQRLEMAGEATSFAK
jgi:hypothetical protein